MRQKDSFLLLKEKGFCKKGFFEPQKEAIDNSASSANSL
jgi:hypothetical protein